METALTRLLRIRHPIVLPQMTRVSTPRSVAAASDTPTHDRLRSILHKRFTPRRVAELQTRVEGLTQGLLHSIRQRREFDLVADFTIPLPVIVIAEMLGIESERFEDFKLWSDALVRLMNGAKGEEEEANRAVMGEFAQYLMEVADHRRSHPAQDLIGTLVERKLATNPSAGARHDYAATLADSCHDIFLD